MPDNTSCKRPPSLTSGQRAPRGPLPPRGPASCLGAIALAGLLGAPALLAPRPARGAPDRGPPGVLVVPTSRIGEVRGLFLRRVSKAIHDSLRFSNTVRVLKDTDRAGKEEDAPGAPKLTAVGRQILRADRVRQEATDLAMAGKHRRAYKKLRFAIKAYELSFSELVDFTKLADAYARAAVSAWHAHKGVREVKELFRTGLALQPTLVIDRRRAGKKLLAVFDGLRAHNDRAPRRVIEVVGATPGATVFVDGVKVGPLPARRGDLLEGMHYVQVRAPGWLPFARSVRLRRKDVKVRAKMKRVPARKSKAVKVWKTGDLLPCAVGGAFTGRACRKIIRAIAKQTGADHVLFSVLAADRYGRLTVHTFLARGTSGRTVALKPVPIAKNLSDLNTRMSQMEEQVEQAASHFPKARTLDKPPRIFKK